MFSDVTAIPAQELTIRRRHSTDTLSLRTIVSPPYSLEDVAPVKAHPQPREATYRLVVGDLTISSHDRWFSRVEGDYLVQQRCVPQELRGAVQIVIEDFQKAIWTGRDILTRLYSIKPPHARKVGVTINIDRVEYMILTLYNLCISLGCLLSRPSVELGWEAAERLCSRGSVLKLCSKLESLSSNMQEYADRETVTQTSTAETIKALEEFASQMVQSHSRSLDVLIVQFSAVVMALLSEKIA